MLVNSIFYCLLIWSSAGGQQSRGSGNFWWKKQVGQNKLENWKKWKTVENLPPDNSGFTAIGRAKLFPDINCLSSVFLPKITQWSFESQSGARIPDFQWKYLRETPTNYKQVISRAHANRSDNWKMSKFGMWKSASPTTNPPAATTLIMIHGHWEIQIVMTEMKCTLCGLIESPHCTMHSTLSKHTRH